MSDSTPAVADTPDMHADAVETYSGAPVLVSFGQRVVFPSAEQYLAVVQQLLQDGFTMCVDLCAVDYQGFTLSGAANSPTPTGTELHRFEVVANFLSIARRERVRVRVQVPGEPPTLPSLFDLYPGVEAMEREAYDLFGVIFNGHPDLTRILLPEDWEGHPLRKDYKVGRVPVQFKSVSPTR
jgi:NADH-quinone oxidoreductase subunit C